MLWQVTIGDDIVCLLGDVHFMLLMLAGFGGFKGRVQRAGPKGGSSGMHVWPANWVSVMLGTSGGVRAGCW